MVVALLAGGCVDDFKGSNVQFDLAATTPVQAAIGATPGPNELPTNAYFMFYAYDTGTDAQGNSVGQLFHVQKLEIHHIVDLGSPCFIDVPPHVPWPGLHVSQFAAQTATLLGFGYSPTTGIDLANPPAGATMAQQIQAATAQQRMIDVAALAGPNGLAVISSASDATYPAVAPDCISPGIPPPTCTDDAANARRLAACQAFWKQYPDYFEGTDRVLTAPLNGVTHGMVDGTNPVNQAPVGGAQFFVDSHLDSFTGYAIYTNTDGAPDPGTLLEFGTPTMATRGVIHVFMTNAADPSIQANVAIFPDLDDDSSSF
ncbi:MAG TPA: hypothetical protein VMJ10_08405 [Kofleriaceae bacterium]|nr:hypothetical protein [Kofleriaceae bacterium]